MIMGLGLFTVAGVAGAIYFIVHQVVVKTALFLSDGLVEHVGGSSRLRRVGDLLTKAPVVAVLFLLPALSLAGFPPFSGFVGKFALLDAGISSAAYWVTAAAVVAAFLTLFTMTKIWTGVFWSPRQAPPEGVPHTVGPLGGPALMVLPTAALVLLSLLIGLAAGPLYEMTTSAAQNILDPSIYRHEVLHR
jgi:multicomponent Na+:H+ antiporter subunit D